MACNGCNIGAKLTLRARSLVGARRRMSEGSRVVRHEILALSTGVLRTLDIASVPIAGLIAYSLRFQSLAIEFQHGLIVILGMVVVANVMAIIDAYNLADIHVWHRQAAKVIGGWSVGIAVVLSIPFFDKISHQYSPLSIISCFALAPPLSRPPLT